MRHKVTRRVTPRASTRDNAPTESNTLVYIMKSLLWAYVITGGLLMLLAVLLYRFDWNEQKVAIGILVIYVLGNLGGGFASGKYMKEKKYLWGMVVGLFYVVLLFLITIVVYRTMNQGDIVTTLILCIASGMIGGMVS